MQSGTDRMDWTPIEPLPLSPLREIPLERICRIFEVDSSLMRPYSLVAQEQQSYYARMIESTRRHFERRLERHLILGVDAVKEPEIALPSFDEVADKVEAKWTQRQRSKSTMHPKESKARRKLAKASRKKNRK